ncbi:hypothetical protein SALBM135S_06482 [Streptomyces alboniger]
MAGAVGSASAAAGSGSAAAGLSVGQLRRQGRRGPHQGQREQGSDALADLDPVGQERFEGHPVQRLGLGGLPAVVPREPPVRRPEGDALGDQRRRGGHHAVEDHRRAPHRALQQEPGHRRQVGAAHRGEQFELVAEDGTRPPLLTRTGFGNAYRVIARRGPA